MSLLESKTAIVTGAGRGMGTRIALALSAAGARVVLHYHDSKEGADDVAAAYPGSLMLQADLRDPESARHLVETAWAQMGSIDILVNNAASFLPDTLFENDSWERYSDEWNGVFGTTFHVTKSIVPLMKSRGSGCIINFAATLLQRPAAGYGAHSASKAAVLSLTKTLARELGTYNIRVNAVSPGMTLTDYSKSLSDGVRDLVAAKTPLRRLAVPDDVAGVVVFYASDLARFVTGANIAPDGGLAML